MRWLPTAFVLVASCRTAPPKDEIAPPPPAPVTPKANAVRVRVAPFDVSACAKPAAVTLTNSAVAAAFLEFERPRFEACLSAPSSREQTQARAVLDLSIGRGISVKTTSSDLTASGLACLEARAKSLPLSSASPVSARLTVNAPVEAPDAISAPLPEVSALREAVTTCCSCFESLGVNAAPQLVLKLGPKSALDVATSSDPVAENIERCLEAALADHPKSGVELTVDLPLLNGDAAAPSPDASAELSATQADAIERRNTAHVLFLDAQRAALTTLLQTVSASYKRKPTPSLAKERSALCGSLIDIEDAIPTFLERAKNASLENVSVTPSTLCAFARETDE